MEVFKIILLVVMAAIVYGIMHDMVTAHFCVEYFTIGHPKVIESRSPVSLALVWGVLATWWFGLIGGVLLALAARAGSAPKFTARNLVRPIVRCLLIMASGAWIAGFLGYFAAQQGWVKLIGPMAQRVPADRHVPFLADLWAHLASYGIGAIAIVVIAFWIRRKRRSCEGAAAALKPTRYRAT